MARRHGCRAKRFLAMQISNDIFFAEVERLLGEGGEVVITIRGNSMQPMLRDGRDKVVLVIFLTTMLIWLVNGTLHL